MIRPGPPDGLSLEPCEAGHVGHKGEAAALRLMRVWSSVVNQIGLFIKHGRTGLMNSPG